MELGGAVFAEQAKGAGEAGKIGNRILVKTSKASIKQAGSQFSFQLSKRPVFEVLQNGATQKPVWGDGRTSKIGRTRAAFGQRLGGDLDQGGIVQQFIERIEQLVGDGSGILGESEVEQRGLSGCATNHCLINIID